MRIVEIAPGVFRAEMTDDERRECYAVDPEALAAFRGEPGSRSIVEVIRESFDRIIRQQQATDA